MNWDVSKELCNMLVAEQAFGITSTGVAALVIQHCSVKNLSLLEFGQTYHMEGYRVIQLDRPELPFNPVRPEDVLTVDPELTESEHGDEPAERPDAWEAAAKSGYKWDFDNWRTHPVSRDRLTVLRKHIAEVRDFDDGDLGEYVAELKNFERRLASIVESGALPFDATVAESAAESAEESEFEDPAEIAKLLENPAAQPAMPPAVNSRGQVLVDQAAVDAIYSLGEKLGMNKVEVEQGIITKARVRRMQDLTAEQARVLVETMKARINSGGV